MMIIPIGPEDASVKRLPWVTLAIILANVAVFLSVGLEGRFAASRADEKLQAAVQTWQQHPYLDLPPEFIERVGGGEGLKLALAIEGAQRALRGDEATLRAEQQRQLNAQVESYIATRQTDPYRSWGLIPSRLEPLAFLKSMFMHAGWGHLFGNMIWLWVTAPFLEAALGRYLFPVFYLLSGVVAALVYVGADPSSDIPLVGASGAIAGLMGAFLVRFWRVKIRYFYWFLLFFGTFRLPAWVPLPIWLLGNLVAVTIHGTNADVAFWAHIGGFGFGALVAYVLALTRVEERFIHPKVEDRLIGVQHPALEEAAAALKSGDTALAREAFERVLAEIPGQQDALLGLWQVAVLERRPQDGAESLVRAIENDVRTGETELAFHHWRELSSQTGQRGPAQLRFKLGCALAPTNPAAAQEVFLDLAGDASAGLLAVKSMGHLAALMPEGEDRRLWEARAAEASAALSAAPAAPLPAVRVAAPRPPPAPPGPRPAPPPTIEVTAPVVERRKLEELAAGGLVLGPERVTLPYPQIAAMAVVTITPKGERVYLLVDFVLAPVAGQPRRVVRLDGRGLDPRRLVGRPDVAPMDAFGELVERISTAAGVRVAPQGSGHAPWPRFESEALYETTVLHALL